MRMTTRLMTTATVLSVALLTGGPEIARAGCGCQKPPPPVAEIRPAFASAGDMVTLFPDPAELVAGRAHVVSFQPSDGSPPVLTNGMAVSRRDFADGVEKLQVIAELPALPIGPASITVFEAEGTGVLLSIDENKFTALQTPVVLGEQTALTRADCYRAAIGTDGTAYFALDISQVADRMIFEGRAKGYRLKFDAADIAIYNTQGILMQLLGPEQAAIYAIDDADEPADPNEPTSGNEWSFRLTYDRHEFNTYNTLHAQHPNYVLDPTDPEWHVDGSRHIDHGHLVIAIQGIMDDNLPPPAGASPGFTFRIVTLHANGGTTPTLVVDDRCPLTGDPPPSATATAMPTSTPTTAPTPLPGCAPAPVDDCGAGVSVLRVKDRDDDQKDELRWKWRKGDAITPSDLGAPDTADGYAFCVYDESQQTPELLLAAEAPAGGACAGKPCWRVRDRGAVYRDKTRTPDGIDAIGVKVGDEGRAKIGVRARGAHLRLPSLPLPLPLRVQLVGAHGRCWDARYTGEDARRNDARRFKASRR